MTTLLDMVSIHIPVLAGELIELLDPQPGAVAVDCTFGGGGHARLVADRIGPPGTLIGIDRDPIAEERFAELAAEVAVRDALHPRRLRDGLAQLRDEGVARRPRLHGPRDVLDAGRHARARLLLRLRRAARHADGSRRRSSTRATSSTSGTSAASRACCASTARSATPAGSPARSCATRAQAPIETTHELVEAIKRRSRRRRSSPAAIPAKRTFQAIRIAVNDELDQLDRALPLAWDVLAPDGRLAAISFHSLEDRRVKRFLADRARGCICPPDLPVCACGRTPEAELLSRRAIAPTPGEVAHNPVPSPPTCAEPASSEEAGRQQATAAAEALSPPPRRGRQRAPPAPPRALGAPHGRAPAARAVGRRARRVRAPRLPRPAPRPPPPADRPLGATRARRCARCPTTGRSTA